jgi:hypothetical protein
VACSSTEDDVAEVPVNPTYDPATGEVTTNFVFNVSTGNSGTTRMTSDNVQGAINSSTAELFRGIENAVLFSYKMRNSDNTAPLDGQHVAYEPTPIPTIKMFTLGTIMAKGAISPATTDGTKTQSRRVVELSLPTETNTLLFYGKAIKDGTDQAQGSVNVAINPNGNLGANYFRLNKIIADGSDMQIEFQQSQALIAAVLTNIIQTSYTLPTDLNVDGRIVSSGKTYKWSDYVTITRDQEKPTIINKIEKKGNDPVIANGESANSMSGLGEILAEAYVSFNTIYNQGGHSELRAGSGPAVKRMINDLYQVLFKVKSATPTNLEETVAMRLADVICANIGKAFDTSVSFEFQKNSSLISFVGSTSSYDKLNVDATLNDFPKTKFNLPYGATILEISYNTSANAPEYNYMGAVPTYAMGGSTSAFNPSNYVFPPELMYFGNSPIRTTNTTKGTSDYPDGTTNWMDDNNNLWGDWTNNAHVLSTTRAVAMKNCINYANALLKCNVKYGTNALKDNNHQIQYERTGANETDNVISVATGAAGMFELTGILVGGQNRTVGWDFIPRADASINEPTAPQFKYMVYDSEIPNGTIPAATSASGGSASADVYTLLWDNWDYSLMGQSQRTVYVALEFKNNSGKDFWGMNNLIPKDGTFYITGKLDPDVITVNGKTAAEITADKSLGVTWPAAYEMPPYYTAAQATAKGDETLDKKTIKERRVFMQDYVTEATFVLTENSLKYALVAVPDLRSTQISLGLSVDLHWREGLKFTNVPLEGGQ